MITKQLAFILKNFTQRREGAKEFMKVANYSKSFAPRTVGSMRLCVILFGIVCFFFLSCTNPFEVQKQKQQAGLGYVTLSIETSATGRSILPAKPVPVSYVLKFTKVGDTSVTVTENRSNSDLNNPIYLEPGPYTLAVDAKDASGNLVAHGELDTGTITIIAGSGVSGTVTLYLITDNASGSFSWNITLPDGIDSAVMTIESLSGGSEVAPVNLLTIPNSKVNDINAGFYQLTIELTKSDTKPVKHFEALHIYGNLTSDFTFVFTDDHFQSVKYIVTYNYNDGVTAAANQTVYHIGHSGSDGKAPEMVPPVRAFAPVAALYHQPLPATWTFDNWYFSDSPWNFNTIIFNDIELNGKWIDPVIDVLGNGETYSFEQAIAYTNDNAGDYILFLDKDIDLGPQILNNEQSLTLKGIGEERMIRLESNGALFTINYGITLVLNENITLQGRSDNTASLVIVNYNGNLVMNDSSSITGNNFSSSSPDGYDGYWGYYGGGVHVSGGTFTMNGGKISGNIASGCGGGVYVISIWDYDSGSYVGGTFMMNDGKIIDNTAYNGGGVSVNQNGIFIMEGGEISENNSFCISGTFPGGGGGVFIIDGTFTMNNGKITSNFTSQNGGGVLNGGTFDLINGEIFCNSAGSGGGVCSGFNYGYGIFTMDGGTIFNNTTIYSGGGVYVGHYWDYDSESYLGSTFNMNGGNITGNTAGDNGGGVYVKPGSNFNKAGSSTGGTINGYAAGVSNSNVVMDGSDTILNGRGHAVYVDNDPAKQKEATAGPTVSLSYDGTTDPPTYSGAWDYLVTFNANGATSGTVPSQVWVTEGSGITLPGVGDLERTGYTFGGWNTEADGTGTHYNSGASYTPSNSITLNARWYSIAPEMVYIPAGTFTMGSPENEPGRDDYVETQHEVTLTKDFYMGKYPVTQTQYQVIMGNNPSRFTTSSGGDNPANHPVETVYWYDAIIYCNKLSILEGLTPAYCIPGYSNSTDPDEWIEQAGGTVPTDWDDPRRTIWDAVEIVDESTGYRLPTEAQWEYACRAGTTTAFNWGTDYIDDTKANYGAHYVDENNTAAGTWLQRTTGVGNYAHNNWGLYDMHGNVWEWCWDWYGAYSSVAQEDPLGAPSGSTRVLRGGSWSFGGRYARSAYRSGNYPIDRLNYVGFRLVRP